VAADVKLLLLTAVIISFSILHYRAVSISLQLHVITLP